MQIQRTGVKTKTLVERTPYYNLHIGQTTQTGFMDNTHQQLLSALDNGPLSVGE